MALERQTIEKKDFPIGRRGYDPDAVDAHLAALADQVDELRRSSRRRTETLASAASDQVRAIVEAAEAGAAEIQRQAEDDAADIRAEARRESAEVKEQASAQAREYVGNVSESTSAMLQRIDAMQGELGTLLESLRTGSNRLNADLQLLEGNLGELRESVTPRPRFEPEEQVRSSRSVAQAPPAPAPAPAATPAPPEPRPAPELETTSIDEDDEAEGARLIALNMALNGTPRDETDRYLAENFELSDRRGLLEEVYASVED